MMLEDFCPARLYSAIDCTCYTKMALSLSTLINILSLSYIMHSFFLFSLTRFLFLCLSLANLISGPQEFIRESLSPDFEPSSLFVLSGIQLHTKPVAIFEHLLSLSPLIYLSQIHTLTTVRMHTFLHLITHFYSISLTCATHHHTQELGKALV